MLILCLLIAVVSTAIASPMAEGLLGLTDLSNGFSVDGISPSAERSNEYALQVMTGNDEALTWQDPATNVISTPSFPENPIAYSTNFFIASTGHPVEKEIKGPVDPGERFQNFDCNDSNGVCCMGNPLSSHRAAQRCEQKEIISDAGNEFLWPVDSRIAHYCYKPEYIDDCSQLLDEESTYRGFLCFSNCGDPKT